MKYGNLANKLLSLLAAVLIFCLSVFAVPSQGITLAQIHTFDIWENDGSYDYYDNGTLLDDLGITAYNNYLREVNAENELPEVVVAVIDSGIDMTNPKFAGRVVEDSAININSNAGEPDVWQVDLGGHGSHVAGIIVDATLPNVKILPIKIFKGTANESVPATILIDAVDELVKIKTRDNLNVVAANMSLGTDANIVSTNSDTFVSFQKAMNKLRQNGILPIVAAGNGDEPEESPIGYGDPYYSLPAACSGVLAVTAYNTTEMMLAKFSNYGKHVSLSAPGVNIISAAKSGSETKTAKLSGTSMATPFVTACYAMLMSDTSKTTAADFGLMEWTANDLKYPYYYLNMQHKALLLHAVDLGKEGKDIYFGYGGVNVADFATTEVEPVASVSAEELDSARPDIVVPTTPDPFAGMEKFFLVVAVLVIVVLAAYAIRYRIENSRLKHQATGDDNE